MLDVDPNVERGAQPARLESVELAPASVVLEKASARRADDADHIRDDSRGRLDAAGAGPLEGDLADRVPLEHDRVEGAFDRRKRMTAVDKSGWTRTSSFPPTRLA